MVGESSAEEPRNLPAVPLAPLRSDDPAQLGQFRLLGRLGTGGMGIAYLASDPDQNWIVVKRIWPHLAADGAFRSRLKRELNVMRNVTSKSTAALADSSADGDESWFAMEFIPGVTLSRRVEDGGPLDPDAVERFAREFLDVLLDVHTAGVTHRDLKPSNIMLSPTGPRLIDFGIADFEGATQLTQTGSILGSSGWLAPEQVRGDAATFATDVHAWALSVVFAATGQNPFGADNSAAAIYRVLESTPDVPTSLSPALVAALKAALTKDPGARPTVTQLRMQLGEVHSSPRTAESAQAQAQGTQQDLSQLRSLTHLPAGDGSSAPVLAEFSRTDVVDSEGESPIRWGSFWVTFWVALLAIRVLPVVFRSVTQEWMLVLLIPLPVAIIFFAGLRPSEFVRVRRSPLTYLAILLMSVLLVLATFAPFVESVDGPISTALIVVLLVSIWPLTAAWVGLLARRTGRNFALSLSLGIFIPVLGALIAFFLTAPSKRQKVVYALTLGTMVSYFLLFSWLGASGL